MASLINLVHSKRIVALACCSGVPASSSHQGCYRRRTSAQQKVWNIDLSCSFYYLFFSFLLIELKLFGLKGKVLGEKNLKKKIRWSCSFYYLFFSFLLIEQRLFVLKRKVLGEKCWKVLKSVKNSETILPFSCCPLSFLWALPGAPPRAPRFPGAPSRALPRALSRISHFRTPVCDWRIGLQGYYA